MDSQHKILMCSVLFSYIFNSRKIHWCFVFFLSFPLDATSKNNDKLFFFFLKKISATFLHKLIYTPAVMFQKRWPTYPKLLHFFYGKKRILLGI